MENIILSHVAIAFWLARAAEQGTLHCASSLGLCSEDMPVVDSDFWPDWLEKAGRKAWGAETHNEAVEKIKSVIEEDLDHWGFNLSIGCLGCQANAVACSLGQAECFTSCLESSCSSNCRLCIEKFCNVELACGGIANISVQAPRTCDERSHDPQGRVKNLSVAALAAEHSETVCFAVDNLTNKTSATVGATQQPATSNGVPDQNCTDQSEEVFAQMVTDVFGLTLPGAFGCSILFQWGALGAELFEGLGFVFADCSDDLQAVCLSRAQRGAGVANETACSRWETLGHICCNTCRALEGTRSEVTGPLDEVEASALREFALALGLSTDMLEGTNPCAWSTGIFCHGDGRYDMLWEDNNLSGSISTSVSKLKSMRMMTLANNRLSGTLPDEIGRCIGLEALDLSDNKFTGTLPESLGELTSLRSVSLKRNNFKGWVPEAIAKWQSIVNVDISQNRFYGKLRPSLFDQWTNINVIDFSQNQFEDQLPDLSKLYKLVTLDVAGNNFIGLAGGLPSQAVADDGIAYRLRIDMAENKLVSLPAAFQNMSTVTHLSLRANFVSSLPKWGSNSLSASIMNRVNTRLKVGDFAPCDETTLTAPKWPFLVALDFSMNPLGVAFDHFLRLFNQAPNMISLSCINCGLRGETPDDLYMRFVPEWVLDADGKLFQQCRYERAFANLQQVDFSQNIGLPYTVIFADAERDEPLQCMVSCPMFSTAPQELNMLTPFKKTDMCQCLPTMIVYQSGDIRCGCDTGFWMNNQTLKCEPCIAGLECNWRGDARSSLNPPPISPAFWVDCNRQGIDFSISLLFSCASKDTCLGGPSFGIGCSEEVHCATNREGQACSLCKPGFWGTSVGACEPCSSGGSYEYLIRFIIIGLASTPVLLVFIHMLAAKKRRRMTRLLKRLRVAFRSLMKYVSLLSLFAGISVEWPDSVKTVFTIAKKIGPEIGLDIPTGCMAERQTAAVSVLSQWLLPVVMVIASILAAVFSHLFGRVLQHAPCEWLKNIGRNARVDLEVLVTFIFLLWSVGFPALIKSSFIMFHCIRSPNGKLLVSQHPHLECFSPRWMLFLPGSLFSILLYVICYLAASSWMVRKVAQAMEQSHMKDRGPWAFVADGVRSSCVHWHIVAALRELLLNAIILVFSGDGTSQLLSSCLVLIVYLVSITKTCPYDTPSLNVLEIWTTSGLAVLLMFTAGLGFSHAPGSTTVESFVKAGAEDSVYRTRALWLLVILVISLIGPVFLIIYELAILTKWRDRMPKAVRPKSRADRKKEENQILQCTQNFSVMSGYISQMDAIEWSRFAWLLENSAATCHLFRKKRRGLRGVLVHSALSRRKVSQEVSSRFRMNFDACECLSMSQAISHTSSESSSRFSDEWDQMQAGFFRVMAHLARSGSNLSRMSTSRKASGTQSQSATIDCSSENLSKRPSMSTGSCEQPTQVQEDTPVPPSLHGQAQQEYDYMGEWDVEAPFTEGAEPRMARTMRFEEGRFSYSI